MSGKICTRCQVYKDYSGFYKSNQAKDSHDSWCKDCRNELSRKRYAPKKEDTKNSKWSCYQDGLKRCKECSQYKSIDNYSCHPTHWDKLSHVCKACTNVRSKLHPKSPELSRRWYANNKQRKLDKYNEWRKKNPDKTKAIWHRYKSHKLQADGDFSAQQWEAIKSYYCPNDLCLDCGINRKLTFDHVIPLSKGGSNYIANIQPLCGNCNSKKSNYHSTDFRPDKGEFARSLME